MAERIGGRLVLDDDVVSGRLVVEDGRIAAIEADRAGPGGRAPDGAPQDGPVVMPGFIDVHVHGWGGHDAMGGTAALDGMARALARRGVTSFLPTAVTASLERLAGFADGVRAWMSGAPGDGAEPLGFNLEGPFLAEARKGAHPAALLRDPADVSEAELAPLLDGLRVITIAPERPGALELIRQLAGRGVRISLGHSAADVAEARAGFAAGAVTTTHLFNAMVGLHHRDPGLALQALLDDEVWVELIADGIHVDPGLWPLIWRLKPAERLLLVSDAIFLAGTDQRRGRLGELEVEFDGHRVTLVGSDALAGSVSALDLEVRNLVEAGASLPAAALAASANPATLLGLADRGRLAVGLRADLVELDGSLAVRRVMRGGDWIA